ncbi:MAG: bifunctional nuclease family protein [Bacteroidaceae bacterium]|nr:bifunctional nuclease family protein [Bacteroidaceae bacterium]
MVELRVVDIVSKVADDRACVLLLQERAGLRKIMVALGLPEAQSIIFSRQGKVPPRPLTHHLVGSLADAFGIKMLYVLIHSINDGTFCSSILFERGDEVRKVDSRTSDAIALALLSGVPILITEELLGRTCIRDEQNGAISVPINAVKGDILRQAMDEAVRNENYELAKALKEELDSRRAAATDN